MHHRESKEGGRDGRREGCSSFLSSWVVMRETHTGRERQLSFQKIKKRKERKTKTDRKRPKGGREGRERRRRRRRGERVTSGPCPISSRTRAGEGEGEGGGEEQHRHDSIPPPSLLS